MFPDKGVFFERVTEKVLTSGSHARDVFPDWRKEKECWLFLAPHDDDIVCGAGLTFLSALYCDITVHAVITTNGNQGYCRPNQRVSIAQIRQREATESFRILGLPDNNLHFLGYDDTSLYRSAGRRFADEAVADYATVVKNATGLQNSFTWILRKIRPTRVFMPTSTDLHPDHQMAHNEMIISVFHASGGIWPELGSKLDYLPQLYEYATYSDFISPPTIRVRTAQDILEKKLSGIMAYKSQEQIELLIQVQRQAGAQEYIRELKFNIMEPGKYDYLFDAK